MPNVTYLEQPISNFADVSADALLVPVFSEDGNGQWVSPLTTALDNALDGLLTDELAYHGNKKWHVGDSLALRVIGQPFRTVMLCGFGRQDKVTLSGMRRGWAAGVNAAEKAGIRSAMALVEVLEPLALTVHQLASSLAEAALLSTYRFTRRRTEASLTPVSLNAITLGCYQTCQPGAKQGFQQGVISGEATNVARDWVFDSANHVTPTALKTFAETTLGKDGGQTVSVLTLDELNDKGMGAFYSVGKGSDEPGYLVHAQYMPKTMAPKKRIALVGKGITFDSGGLSLKPSKSMELMKLDMAGAAAVLATMAGLAKLQAAGIEIPVQVDGFVGLCENMPSARASKPGDIVTTLAGKTVEINNTDAEGRLVLIDVLTHAQQTVDPDEIIDLATLTGAAITALGHAAAAIVSREKDHDFQAAVIDSGAQAGETFWPLPLLDDYKESLKSDVADFINAGSKGQAGTASAGMFLSEFVDEHRGWAHLDIAGPAYTHADKPEIPKGATGFGVRTLLHYLLSHAQ